MNSFRFKRLPTLLLAAAAALASVPASAASIALQVERSTGGNVSNSANTVFDSVVFSSGNISYNSVTGVITFNEAGRYVVSWWVDYRGVNGTSGAMFALSSSQGDYIRGNSSAPSGQVSGIGIVEVVSAPVTLSLINASGGTAILSSITSVKAALTVVQDDPPAVVAL